MKCVLKVLIALLIACFNIKLLSSMHNPMIRIACQLGEKYECVGEFLICWKYHCNCLPDHVPLGLGLGCVHQDVAETREDSPDI